MDLGAFGTGADSGAWSEAQTRIRQFLAKHRIRRCTAEQVAQILGAPALPLAGGSVEAASEYALLLILQLRVLWTMRTQVADRMQKLMDKMSATQSDASAPQIFHDASVLRSLPGIGRIVSGILMAEAAGPLGERNYHAIRAHGGIAPITRQSGKSKQVGMRYRCNTRLRNAFYHWACSSVQHDARSKQHYARLRACGHSHGRALRGVADRLLFVLTAMLKSGRYYDPGRRSAVAADASAT